ncbi:LytTR family DNA-binding domain-containing protein [Paenibacillus tepidiphilus]|uniref:LytTR family DNA-binding domain-containing protein n=1 Tax=Paenibacillus tepidiphilus TaxID=2608683 RepID=UPI00123B656B|nr:LytTR family DNA-binding domain-containing protein [Paenibacillus tepidiphilus]
MSSISVSKDPKGTTGLFTLEIAEINYMEFEGSMYRILVHTRDELYYTVGTLKYWLTALSGSGYNFVLADRNTLIHVTNIVQIDKTFNIAYFGENAAGTQPKCFLSEKGYREVSKNIKATDTPIQFIELPMW